MIKAIEANQKLRHAHMIGITEEIMKDGMCSDYKEIQRISRLVYDKVKNARKITSPDILVVSILVYKLLFFWRKYNIDTNATKLWRQPLFVAARRIQRA